MKIEDSFRVEVPVDEAWKVLLDIERIAPCMPGASLTRPPEGEQPPLTEIEGGHQVACHHPGAETAVSIGVKEA